ncbi:MAG: sodium:alanine symporter family protein [Planctomycetes bacterium]|nr:sodium:alanine symporter family protein [Planctomycetota bacterium]
MENINNFVHTLNGIFFHPFVVYALLFTGVLFTVWTGFGQYRAVTHGVRVIRGKYDNKDDPGAISHFQALSAALSATVGLGNIAGVGLAVALGGPGAVFWMWVIGVLGMAIKMTEVTQSMLYRNTDDPNNPHGGPMYVVKSLLSKQGGSLGATIGGIFCLTLILSAVTGGNMFQAWNVADVTTHYFDVPGLSDMRVTDNFNPETFAIGIVLAIIVGAVIVGGIKRIGKIASRLVPFMCVIYLAAGLIVLMMNISVVPGLLMLIFKEGLGLGESTAAGAFLGGSFGYAALWGIKRALFSSESGQGSAPIAHAAAKCTEPVREGVVAGLEPFIDTLVVCTITALIILSSGAWNRDSEMLFPEDAGVTIVQGDGGWVIEAPALSDKNDESKRISRVPAGESGWSNNDSVFMIIEAEVHPQSKITLHRMNGKVREDSETGEFTVEWTPHPLAYVLDDKGKKTEEVISATIADFGVYVDYTGATLTAHAFDRTIPGLGKWLVVFAAWLFAISTMISWSYYGEQGIYYFFGTGTIAGVAVTTYRVVYSILVAVSTIGFISTDVQLDMWTTLGLGAMLVANIPIMLIYGPEAMRAYHKYIGKLKAGEFDEK